MKHKRIPPSKKLKRDKSNRERDIETLKQHIDFFIYHGVELFRGEINFKAQIERKRAPTSINITLQK